MQAYVIKLTNDFDINREIGNSRDLQIIPTYFRSLKATNVWGQQTTCFFYIFRMDDFIYMCTENEWKSNNSAFEGKNISDLTWTTLEADKISYNDQISIKRYLDFVLKVDKLVPQVVWSHLNVCSPFTSEY